MKKYLILLGIIVFSQFVFSESPPAIPMNVWGEATMDGSPVADGLSVTAMVNGVDYAQASVTQGGGYDVILVNGDRPLTFNNDPNCVAHDLAGEACVQCIPGYGPDHPGNENEYCIEGPEDLTTVFLEIDGKGAMPYAEWFNGSFEYIEIVSPIGDWAKNGCVNTGDIPPFADHYGMICGDPNWDPIYDLLWDCIINTGDIPIFADHYGEGC